MWICMACRRQQGCQDATDGTGHHAEEEPGLVQAAAGEARHWMTDGVEWCDEEEKRSILTVAEFGKRQARHRTRLFRIGSRPSPCGERSLRLRLLY